MVSSVSGQSERKLYSLEEAEKSFRTLVAAKDSDILGVMKDDGLVCLADSLPFDSRDRFLTLVLPRPTSWLPETRSGEDEKNGSIYDGKSDGPAFTVTVLSLRV